MPRYDLTNWIIHFVHKKNSDADPYSIYDDDGEYEDNLSVGCVDGELFVDLLDLNLLLILIEIF